MAEPVLVPSSGESITEAELSTWHKKNGDYVKTDDILAELETEKATLEIRSPASGKLKLLREEGNTVRVGDTLAEVDTALSASSLLQNENERAGLASQKEETAMPAALVATSEGLATENAATEFTRHENKVFATPAARKLMHEQNLRPEELFSLARQSSGKDIGGGLGLKRPGYADVLKALQNKPAPAATLPAHSEKTAETASELSNMAGARERELVKKPLSRIRLTIAKRLTQAQQSMALLSTFNEIDMHALIQLRKRYKESFKEKYGVGLGYMSFFTKAVALALAKFPIINSRIEEDHMLQPSYADISIAVSSPKGLVTPVLKNAERRSFQDIESCIKTFAIKAKENKLSMDDMRGGTFTITNGGIFGSMLSTPIVNFPQSAILGMHNIVQRPVAADGEVLIHPIMYVALTYDHRLIDGAEAVQFLFSIKEYIEDPFRLLLNV